MLNLLKKQECLEFTPAKDNSVVVYKMTSPQNFDNEANFGYGSRKGVMAD